MELDCLKCDKNCCKNAVIYLDNVLDFAKILYTIKNYEFESIHVKNRGFGKIKHEGKEIITINEKQELYYGKIIWIPLTQLKNPCTFLTNENLCSIHNETINQEINLGTILKEIGYNNKAKPRDCKDHPAYYDNNLHKVMIHTPCHIIDYNNIINSHEPEIIKEIENEEKIANKIQELLIHYYKKTGTYLLYETANNLATWKKKNPLKALEQKINELKTN